MIIPTLRILSLVRSTGLGVVSERERLLISPVSVRTFGGGDVPGSVVLGRVVTDKVGLTTHTIKITRHEVASDTHEVAAA